MLKRGIKRRAEKRKEQIQQITNKLSTSKEAAINLTDEEFECVERIVEYVPTNQATSLSTPTIDDDSSPGTPHPNTKEPIDLDDSKVPPHKGSYSESGQHARPIMRLQEKLKAARRGSDVKENLFTRRSGRVSYGSHPVEQPVASMDDNESNGMNGDFNYSTDLCREKKFNKNELEIIVKVLKLELQPLVLLVLLIKGLLLWTNSAVSVGMLLVLLYVAYMNVVEWLLGIAMILSSLTMFSMKMDADTTGFMLCCLVGMVTPIDDDDSHHADANGMKNEREEDQYIGWRARKMRRKIKKLRSNFGKLGEGQFLLYRLTIMIGKVRAILLYKEEDIGKVVCIGLAVSGAVCIVLSVRSLYTLVVIISFSAKPLMEILKKRKELMKQKGIITGNAVQKVKALLDSVEPDIPLFHLQKEE